jgi:hypothetical protein
LRPGDRRNIGKAPGNHLLLGADAASENHLAIPGECRADTMR